MSWLSNELNKAHIRFDSHTLGNLVKNVAPVAGTVVGGPLGLAVGGGLGALGGLGRGESLGTALKSGISNAGLTGAGEAAGSAFGYHGGLGSLTGGGNAVPEIGPSSPSAIPTGAPPPAAINSGVPNLETASGSMPSMSDVASAFNASRAVAPTTPIPGIASDAGPEGESAIPTGGSVNPQDQGFSLGKLASGIGNFAENHDRTTAAALGALGNLQSAGTENRLRSAQAANTEATTAQSAYALARQKAQDLALEPLRQALYTKLGSLGSAYGAVPTDPYAVPATGGP